MEVQNVKFPDLPEGEKGEKMEARALGDVPVMVTVELGGAQLSLKEILDFSEGSIVELNRLAGEPLDLKVGGQVVAQGEVVAVDDYYGLRITNVVMK
ncbi:MAG: flagellar motor switch protein FliN [bacterium]